MAWRRPSRISAPRETGQVFRLFRRRNIHESGRRCTVLTLHFVDAPTSRVEAIQREADRQAGIQQR